MVELYNSGKPRAELVREYELTPSALSSWIKKYNNTGSFHADVNSKIKITKKVGIIITSFGNEKLS